MVLKITLDESGQIRFESNMPPQVAVYCLEFCKFKLLEHKQGSPIITVPPGTVLEKTG